MTTINNVQSALYLDLEMNCADRYRPGAGDPEIVEIGIVELDLTSLVITREANYFVRPRLDISWRCTEITGLTKDDFKGALPLKDVIASIRAQWPKNATCIAWGNDEAILARACRRYRLPMPFRRFLDLSQIVRRILLLQHQLSVRAAIELFGLPFDGCAHMAVADARNTARIHAEIIRRLRESGVEQSAVPETSKEAPPTWFGEVLKQSLGTIDLA